MAILDALRLEAASTLTAFVTYQDQLTTKDEKRQAADDVLSSIAEYVQALTALRLLGMLQGDPIPKR